MPAIIDAPAVQQAQPATEHSAPDIPGAALARAIADGYEAWAWARAQRDEAIAQLCGERYEKDQVPSNIQRAAINLIAQTFVTLLPSLFPHEIKHVCRVTDPRLEFDAMVVAADLDHRAEEEALAETVMLAGCDALFAPCGVLVTRMKAGNDLYKINGNLYDNGAFYTTHVDLDDYACDPTARRRGEFRWEAIRWRASRRSLLASGIYPAEKINALPGYSTQGDNKDELVETVQCWDVYVYQGDRILCVTLGGNFCNSGDPTHGAEVLAKYEFQGPASGPIRWISFYEIPGKPAPLPPVLLWRELHDAIAKVGDKLVRSILESKVIGAYRPTAIDDAKAAKDAAHLELVKMQDPDGLKFHTIEGLSDTFWSGFGWLSEQGSQAAGNIKLKAGTASGADTATEASILSANSDDRTRWMRDRINKTLKQLANDRAWYILTDPIINKLTGVRQPGGEFMSVEYTAEAKEGDPIDFQFDVQPFQPESGDPNVRLRRITELLSTVLPAVFPLIQAGVIDPQGMVRMISREFGTQDFDQVIAASPQLQMRVSALQSMMPQPAALQGTPQPMAAGGPRAAIGEVRGAMAPGGPGQ